MQKLGEFAKIPSDLPLSLKPDPKSKQFAIATPEYHKHTQIAF